MERARPRLQLAVYDGEEVTVHPLPESGTITLGRAPDATIRIDNQSVSRKHAMLHLGDTLRVEDLGGSNGTFVRDPASRDATNETETMTHLGPGETMELRVGDTINLGSAVVVIRHSDAATPNAEDALRNIVLRDPQMQALYEQAGRAARALISVLILGETGVGKEVLAHEIHRSSARASGPFTSLNCAALSETLLEGELFGHERGAFTGANQTRPGLFEATQGGTLFLDEIGELTPATQVKLLRVLEDRKILRVGGRKPIDVDVRFIAATNRDLEAEVEKGTFRKDLYFRLNGISLTIPPLRNRQTEIEPLARVFVDRAARQIDRNPPGLATETLACLARYEWPGNVRELRNVMERAVVLCSTSEILPEHLPARLANSGPIPSNASPAVAAKTEAAPKDSMMELQRQMQDLERDRIVQVLAECGGNQTKAARLLGISRRTLVTRLGEFGLPRPRK